MSISEDILTDSTQGTPFPSSHRIYVDGTIHRTVRVPMREVHLADTKEGMEEKSEEFRRLGSEIYVRE